MRRLRLNILGKGQFVVVDVERETHCHSSRMCTLMSFVANLTSQVVHVRSRALESMFMAEIVVLFARIVVSSIVVSVSIVDDVVPSMEVEVAVVFAVVVTPGMKLLISWELIRSMFDGTN